MPSTGVRGVGRAQGRSAPRSRCGHDPARTKGNGPRPRAAPGPFPVRGNPV